MERVASIPVGARVYLERQLQAGTREARFLQSTYSHPLGRRLALQHALRTGTAVFRGRLYGAEPSFLVVRLDEAPEAITVLFTSGLQVGMRADKGKVILAAQVAVVGSTLDGEVFVVRQQRSHESCSARTSAGRSICRWTSPGRDVRS